MAKKRKLLEAPEEDFASWQRAAAACGMALAPWMRRQLNIAAENDAEARRQDDPVVSLQTVLPNGPGKRTFKPDFK